MVTAGTRARAGAILAAAAVAISGCGGCGNIVRGRAEATRTVAEFHDAFNAGRFDSIYDAASDDFRRAARREDFAALLAAVRRKLGNVTGSTTQNWNVTSRNLTTSVALVQETTYATGRATETFRFVIRDGRAVLVGYNVSSNDLVLR